jgi:hypothetical protein
VCNNYWLKNILRNSNYLLDLANVFLFEEASCPSNAVFKSLRAFENSILEGIQGRRFLGWGKRL